MPKVSHTDQHTAWRLRRITIYRSNRQQLQLLQPAIGTNTQFEVLSRTKRPNAQLAQVPKLKRPLWRSWVGGSEVLLWVGCAKCSWGMHMYVGAQQARRTAWVIGGSMVMWLLIMAFAASHYLLGLTHTAAEDHADPRHGLQWTRDNQGIMQPHGQTFTSRTYKKEISETLQQQAAQKLLECSQPARRVGFDYPNLRPVRALLAEVVCHNYSILDVHQAYNVAIHQAAAKRHVRDTGPLQGFIQAALGLVVRDADLMKCSLDASLIDAFKGNDPAAKGAHSWSLTNEQPPHSRNDASIGSSQHDVDRTASHNGQTYLLAANFHNNGMLMPNFIMQVLELAVLLQPGSLAVSVYESGSSDLTPYWLTLLRMLLLPLRVPQNITTMGHLKASPHMDRISLMAALRNAVLDPFITRYPASAPSAAALQQFVPDYIVFVNDVYFCAADALRLTMYKADISCGMDFYTAPWDADTSSHNNHKSSKADDTTSHEMATDRWQEAAQLHQGRHLHDLQTDPEPITASNSAASTAAMTGPHQHCQKCAPSSGSTESPGNDHRHGFGMTAYRQRQLTADSSTQTTLKFYDKVGEIGVSQLGVTENTSVVAEHV